MDIITQNKEIMDAWFSKMNKIKNSLMLNETIPKIGNNNNNTK
jgi:hypothetical protein